MCRRWASTPLKAHCPLCQWRHCTNSGREQCNSHGRSIVGKLDANTPSCCSWSRRPRSALLLDVLKERRRLELHCSRESYVLRDASVRLSALHACDLRDGDTGTVSQRFLRQVTSRTFGANVPPDALQYGCVGLSHQIQPDPSQRFTTERKRCNADQICCLRPTDTGATMNSSPDAFDEPTVARLKDVAQQLQIDTELPLDELVDAVVAAPGGERMLVMSDETLDRKLRLMFSGLAREGGYLDSGIDWIEFLSADAHIVVRLKPGFGNVLSLDAYLLCDEGAEATQSEVAAWVEVQPQPALGMLLLGERHIGGADSEPAPMLTLDLRADGVMSEFVSELLAPYVKAWASRSAARPEPLVMGPEGEPYRVRRATLTAPSNTWLVMASEASFLTEETLLETRRAEDAGIYDLMWTAPKNGQAGDLCLIYFAAPRSAVHFVARLASQPFWSTDIYATSDHRIDRHQWWAYLSPPVEVEPVSSGALRAAFGGYLTLKGRSGHYVPPQVTDRLSMRARDEARQSEFNDIFQPPSSTRRISAIRQLTLESWRSVPGGLLPLEAKVSELVVLPLIDLMTSPLVPRDTDGRAELTSVEVVAEHRVSSGYVDFVLNAGTPPVPALAIEVKLATPRPSSGRWRDSADGQVPWSGVTVS
jgi:hypothetical protein